MSQKLDNILINPSALKLIYQELSNTYSAIEPPIWAALLANNLRKNFNIDLWDCEGEQLILSDIIERLKSVQTRLITIVIYGQQPSASTQNMHGASILTNEIKKHFPNQKILLLGGHVSALPEKTMIEENCDFVCQGEGVDTLNQLLKTDLENNLENVPGLWFKNQDKIIKPSRASKVTPQDELDNVLPGMAYDLLPMKNYRAHNWHAFGDLGNRSPYVSLYTSLGCPFKCSFCCINAPFGTSSFRYWSPSFIVDQIETLVNSYGVKNIKFADEMFVLREKHFLEICKLIIERNIKDLNIWAYARVDTIKEKHLKIMRKAGIKWIILGIESESEFVRSGVEKGQFTRKKIKAIVKMIQDNDIYVHANYIFGLPDDNYESMNNTLDMAIELNTEMANFYSAMAYPGSELYFTAITNNLPLPNNWLGYSQHAKNCLPLPTNSLSGKQVLGFRDAAWNKYFTNPQFLNMLKEKFGEETLNHIKELSQFKLTRENIEEYQFTDNT